MKRTWELAFSSSAYFEDLSRVIDILQDWDYQCETVSNNDGDADYISGVYDENDECFWSDADSTGCLRDWLHADCVAYLDRVFGKGKPRVVVGDAVKLPFPRSSHVRS